MICEMNLKRNDTWKKYNHKKIESCVYVTDIHLLGDRKATNATGRFVLTPVVHEEFVGRKMRVTRHLFLFLCLAVFLLVSHPGAVDAAKKSRKKRSRKAKPAVKKNVQQEIEVSASMEEDEGVVVSEPVAEEEAPEPPPPPAQAASAQRSAATLGEDAEKDTEKASETAPEDKPAKKKKKSQNNPFVLITILIVPILLSFCRAKLYFWCRGIVFLLLSSEKRGMSKAPDTEKLIKSKSRKKTIIFIRHGESDWNEIFNKSKIKLLPRLIRGLFREAMYFVTDNSVFIDSPLSQEGVSQAMRLREFLFNYSNKQTEMDELVAALQGRGKWKQDSLLVSSNLRRAINTGCIALWPRLHKNMEKIKIQSSLQEMSRNVDTNALAGAAALPEMSLMKDIIGKEFRPGMYLDPSESEGNKGLCSTGYPRMKQFCQWAMDQKESVIIVSAGHSLWFKNFFKIFLRKSSNHHSKTLKMKNCAAVSFSLVEGTIDGGTHFTITEDSFCEIFEGFKGKKMAPPRKLSEMSRSSSSHLLRESTPRKSSFNSDKPFYEGELGKKARKSLIKEMPRWQTRVFQIQKEQGFYVLKYYSDKGSAAAKKGAKTLPIEFKEIKEGETETEFELVSRNGIEKENFCLRARDKQERDNWIEHIKKAEKKNNAARSGRTLGGGSPM